MENLVYMSELSLNTLIHSLAQTHTYQLIWLFSWEFWSSSPKTYLLYQEKEIIINGVSLSKYECEDILIYWICLAFQPKFNYDQHPKCISVLPILVANGLFFLEQPRKLLEKVLHTLHRDASHRTSLIPLVTKIIIKFHHLIVPLFVFLLQDMHIHSESSLEYVG